ncbi:hypothetical protein AVEN_53239-1 [Araneus ventricosus]|uniref:RNase H type-1 domain-containing protein n=1 Tax=Araneus ventricosus TaxID=182803 RepID=A0A4Y2AAA5_ARAVE|nr:hypothetical protein AVEN_53239-1 [Araneus ventricosus]
MKVNQKRTHNLARAVPQPTVDVQNERAEKHCFPFQNGNGNERADELAKEATAKDTIDYKFNRSCVQMKNDVKKQLIKWQERWDSSQKGTWTKMFFSHVNCERMMGNFFLYTLDVFLVNTKVNFFRKIQCAVSVKNSNQWNTWLLNVNYGIEWEKIGL